MAILFAFLSVTFFFVLVKHHVCAPSWNDTPARDVYALPGDDVTLTWVYDLDGSHVERITWGILSDNNMAQALATQFQNESVSIIPGYAGKVEVILPGTLIVKNVSLTDGHVYGCVLDTTSSLSMFSKTTVTVIGQLPTIQTALPSIQTVQEGDGPFEVQAIVESDSGIKLSWFKDGLGVPSRYIVSTQVIGMTSGGKSIIKSVLQIPSISVNDLGNFSLIGGFGDSIAYAVRVNTFLDVQYSPRNMVFRHVPFSNEVLLGSMFNLTCLVDSNPNSDITIKRSGGVRLNAAGTYWHVIPAAKNSDAGDYFCEAGNGIGNEIDSTLRVTVKDLPTSSGQDGSSDDKDWLYYLVAGLILLLFIIILIVVIRWRKRTIKKRTISQRKVEVVSKANETMESRSASLENLERINNGRNGSSMNGDNRR